MRCRLAVGVGGGFSEKTRAGRRPRRRRQTGVSRVSVWTSFPIPGESALIPDGASTLFKTCLCKHCIRKHGGFLKLIEVEETLPSLLLRALGQRIRELRTQRGYSQEGFADKCGVHRTFMGTIERGESNLSFQNIVKVATTLGVSLSKLFSELESAAQSLAARSSATAARKPKKNR